MSMHTGLSMLTQHMHTVRLNTLPSKRMDMMYYTEATVAVPARLLAAWYCTVEYASQGYHPGSKHKSIYCWQLATASLPVPALQSGVQLCCERLAHWVDVAPWSYIRQCQCAAVKLPFAGNDHVTPIAHF